MPNDAQERRGCDGRLTGRLICSRACSARCRRRIYWSEKGVTANVFLEKVWWYWGEEKRKEERARAKVYALSYVENGTVAARQEPPLGYHVHVHDSTRRIALPSTLKVQHQPPSSTIYGQHEGEQTTARTSQLLACL